MHVPESADNLQKHEAAASASCFDGLHNIKPLWANALPFSPPYSAVCVARDKQKLRKTTRAYLKPYSPAPKGATGFLEGLLLHFFSSGGVQNGIPKLFQGRRLEPKTKTSRRTVATAQLEHRKHAQTQLNKCLHQYRKGIWGRKEKYRGTPCASSLCRDLLWCRI